MIYVGLCKAKKLILLGPRPTLGLANDLSLSSGPCLGLAPDLYSVQGLGLVLVLARQIKKSQCLHITRLILHKGSLRIKKCPKKWKKSLVFLTSPSPRMFWTFLNLGKIGNSVAPPPPVPNLGKI